MSFKVAQLNSIGSDDSKVAVAEEEQIASVIENRRHIAGHKVFIFAKADDDGRSIARRHNLVRLVRRNDCDGEDAGQQLDAFSDRFLQRIRVSVAAGIEVLLDQVGDHLGIGLRTELVAFFDQLPLQADIVLDDAVVHHDDLAGAVAMRMRVLFGRTSMCGPAGVADPISTVERAKADNLFQIAQLAFGTAHLQPFAVTGNSDAGRIIAAILQPPQAIDDDWNDLFLAYITDNAAHNEAPLDVSDRADPVRLERMSEL